MKLQAILNAIKAIFSISKTNAGKKRAAKKAFGGKQKGFTLIEIIIVVVILGLLMAMIVPQIMDSKGKAESGMKEFAGKQKATVEFIEANKNTILTPENIDECTLNPTTGEFSCSPKM